MNERTPLKLLIPRVQASPVIACTESWCKLHMIWFNFPKQISVGSGAVNSMNDTRCYGVKSLTSFTSHFYQDEKLCQCHLVWRYGCYIVIVHRNRARNGKSRKNCNHSISFGGETMDATICPLETRAMPVRRFLKTLSLMSCIYHIENKKSFVCPYKTRLLYIIE